MPNQISGKICRLIVVRPDTFERMNGIHVQNCKIEFTWQALALIENERGARWHTHAYIHTYSHAHLDAVYLTCFTSPQVIPVT